MPAWLDVPRFSVDWRGQIRTTEGQLPALSTRGSPKALRRSRTLSPPETHHDPSQSLRESLRKMGQNHPKITQHRARQCQNRQCALCRANEALDMFDFKRAGGDDLAWQQIRANVTLTPGPSEEPLHESDSLKSLKPSSPLQTSLRTPNSVRHGAKNGSTTFDAERLRAQTEYRALKQAIKAETVRRRGKDGPSGEETRIGKLDFMLGVCRLQELHQKGTLQHFAGEDPSKVRRYVLSMLLLQVDVSQNLPPEAQRIRIQDLQEMMSKAYPSAPLTAVKELTALCEQGRDMSVAAWDFLLLLHYVWNAHNRGQSMALFGFFGDTLHLQQMKRGESAMVQLLDLRMLLTLHERTLSGDLQQTLEAHLINKLDWGIQGQVPYRTFEKAVRAHPSLEALFHATGVAVIQEEWAAMRDAKVSREGRRTPPQPQDSSSLLLPPLESLGRRRSSSNRRSVTFAGM